MSEVLERQIARGGVVGMGDDGPPLLTITTSADKVIIFIINNKYLIW